MTPGVVVTGPPVDGDRVLTDDALLFVAELQRRFGQARRDLLHRRDERQAELDAGERLDVPAGTREIRESAWTVAPAPADFDDRRVEITGPAEPKMMINALNSGAKVFMADLEDALSPTWANVVGGQAALMDAVRGTLRFESPEGKSYQLAERTAQLVVRPRGWHLVESHLMVDGAPVSASLFDAGLYLFHNAAERLARGSGPYLYLPKLESHHEARLWNDVFVWAQAALGVPRGSVRATVLIETITAAFEMDEILYELREHAAGLNAGRWDYLFSVIKRFRADRALSSPDRSQLSMTVPFMRAYTKLLVQTCHRRGAHAIGGMAAFIPNRRDPEVTETRAGPGARGQGARDRATASMARGSPIPTSFRSRPRSSTGSWATVRTRRIGRRRMRWRVAADLADFTVDGGAVTDAGIRANVRVALAYLDSWLRGTGAAAIDNLMEDAATAEIARSQLWLWRTRGMLSVERYAAFRDEELVRLGGVGEGRLKDAWEILDHLVLDDEFAEFLTLRAYAMLD